MGNKKKVLSIQKNILQVLDQTPDQQPLRRKLVIPMQIKNNLTWKIGE
jgi:hypothetical protein